MYSIKKWRECTPSSEDWSLSGGRKWKGTETEANTATCQRWVWSSCYIILCIFMYFEIFHPKDEFD